MSISTNNNTLNEILSMINNLPSIDGSGGGTVYTNIVYNDDNTVTLTDKDGVDHVMVCEYTDGVLSDLTYDGKFVELTYEEDTLVNIGAIEVDMVNAPIESGGGGTEELENLIDESGVLDSTDGTVEDKVKDLIAYNSVLNNITSPCFSGNKELESIDVYLGSPYTSSQEAFYGCTNLKHIVGINTSKCTKNGRTFYLSGIQTVDKPFDFSSQQSASNFSPFDNANYLVEVRIVPNTYKWTSSISSSFLSDESIQSIIEGLATVSSSQSIRFHRDIVAKMTDEQKTTISNKGWTLVQL